MFNFAQYRKQPATVPTPLGQQQQTQQTPKQKTYLLPERKLNWLESLRAGLSSSLSPSEYEDSFMSFEQYKAKYPNKTLDDYWKFQDLLKKRNIWQNLHQRFSLPSRLRQLTNVTRRVK